MKSSPAPQHALPSVTRSTGDRSRITKLAAASALFFVGAVVSSHAITVSISGVGAGTVGGIPQNDQVIIDFLNANFSNITTINYGNYANPASIPVGTDLFMVGRRVFSGEYGNAANSAAFNALTIPVVAFTSYVTRPDGDRWGWHTGGAVGQSLNGTETTVTAAGATAFGGEGTVDWWGTLANSGTNFSAVGAGTIGTGDILATIGGSVLVAHWNAGEQSGMGATFGGDRLLFNLPDNNAAGQAELPNTPAGQAALIAALDAFTPLTANAIPEPSSFAALAGLVGLGFSACRRRRSAS